ncbi:hypothetical protein LY39_02231 [Roseinatronobacter bogoriensis subsp. barguzinensis]|nr:hypothetical protein [Rhodobaca bogoriensis DSM 18756]TDW37878.1 hypothetical protein LY39_02231 [Rhodobaca barguzinensis]TDY69953.1 hypothetical protein EV660_103349 [Rhodobaca bogoriensis DSM 18756]
MANVWRSNLFACLDRHFSVHLPFTRFARNMALLSLAGLMPVLALYIALVPGPGGHLGGSGTALGRFVRQIVTNGLPVVFVVNALGLILFAKLRARRIAPLHALALDIPARIGAFVGLHLAIYPASAMLFGSFGGDPVQALRVTGPTLAQSAGFGNLSGVYLYATLISALPLHMALVGQVLGQQHRTVTAHALIAAALLIFAAQALFLTVLAALL